MRIRNGNSKQRGLGLVDLSLSIGLIGLGIVVTVSIFRTARSDSLAFSAAQDLLEIQQRVRDYYVERDNYNSPAVTNTLVQNLNLAPDQMIGGSPTAIRSRWRTPLTLTTVSDERWRMQVTVPSSECAEFVSQVATNFASVAIDNGGGYTTVVTEGSPDNAGIARRCEEGATPTVRFDSR